MITLQGRNVAGARRRASAAVRRAGWVCATPGTAWFWVFLDQVACTPPLGMHEQSMIDPSLLVEQQQT
jgi:hypothetical protein